MAQNCTTWWTLQHRGWKLLLGLFSIFFLAVFVHFQEVRLEVLELNTTANRYIVAQVDFKFPDYESTIFLKQRAMQEVGSIEQIDPKQLQRVKAELDQIILSSKKWHMEEVSYEEMDLAVDLITSELAQARFTDLKTIHVIKELPQPSSFYYEKNLDEGEMQLDLFFSYLAQMLERRFPSQVIAKAIELFQDTSWMFKRDSLLERQLRAEINKTIPEKYAHIQAGERLIEPGEKITSRHLTMMQAMKQAISESRKLWEPLPIVGSFFLSMIFVFVSILYFRHYQPIFSHSLQQISLFVTVTFITLLLAKCTEYALLRSGNSFLEHINYPIITPFATLLLCVLISPRIALFAAVFLSIILSVSLAVDHSRFLILNLVPSLIVIICTRYLRKRKEVFSIFAKAALSCVPIFYGFTLSENQLWNSSLFIDLSSAFLFLLTSAILAVGLLPAFETLFRILTDMTLMEYTDSSNALLQRLALEVPGTYQHSLMVAHLSEACAVEIGTNSLFCRAAALYHDIGKMVNPQVYTENQSVPLNVHQLLTPAESAQAIISHVTDGEQLARKHRLPQAFIDVIRQHHGTTQVYYFYHQELELKGGKREEINEVQFCYPGPKPQTKESAIIMICDSVEAASRSLDEVTEKHLTDLVEQLIIEKTREGQLEECNITFEELTRVKRKLIKSLFATQHTRVKYPKKYEPTV